MSALGTDGNWLRGSVTPAFAWSSGRLALAQSLARRLMQPRSSLPYWQGYGEDIGALLGSNVSASEIQRRVERQFARDERVMRSEVRPSILSGAITLYCIVEDEDGPFEFVMSATEAATQLISLQGQGL